MKHLFRLFVATSVAAFCYCLLPLTVGPGCITPFNPTPTNSPVIPTNSPVVPTNNVPTPIPDTNVVPVVTGGVWKAAFMFPATNDIWSWCPQPRSPYHKAYSTFNFGTHGWGDGENTYRISCLKQEKRLGCDAMLLWMKMTGDKYNNFDLTTTGELPMFIVGAPSPFDAHYLSDTERSFPPVAASYGIYRIIADLFDSPIEISRTARFMAFLRHPLSATPATFTELEHPRLTMSAREARIQAACARLAHLTADQCVLMLGLEMDKDGLSKAQIQQLVDWARHYSSVNVATTDGKHTIVCASPQGKRVLCGFSYGKHTPYLGLQNAEYWAEVGWCVWDTAPANYASVVTTMKQFQRDVAPAPAWFGELTMDPNSKGWADVTTQLLALHPAGIGTGNFTGSAQQ